jgi:hydrogenase maturation protease
MSELTASTVIIGVGNLLRQDEGVGVHLARRLAERALGEGVAVVDGGTAVEAALAGWSQIARLIVLDAVDGKQPAGTLYRMTLDQVAEAAEAPVSLHQTGLREAIGLARGGGTRVGEVVIVGVQPAATDWGLELSPAVSARLEAAAELVLRELKN